MGFYKENVASSTFYYSRNRVVCAAKLTAGDGELLWFLKQSLKLAVIFSWLSISQCSLCLNAIKQSLTVSSYLRKRSKRKVELQVNGVNKF